MNFKDIEFPRSIGVNSVISDSYDTSIATNGFFERRNSKQTFSRLSADIAYNLRTQDEINIVRKIHDEVRGSRYSFKFLNIFNNSTKDYTKDPTPLDQNIYTFKKEDYSNNETLVVKMRTEANKIIQLPIFDTVFITLINKTQNKHILTKVENLDSEFTLQQNIINSLQQYVDTDPEIPIEERRVLGTITDDNATKPFIDINYFTGDITFTFGQQLPNDTLDTDEVEVYIGCNFFNKMRFESDTLSVVGTGFETRQLSDCMLIEVFE